MGLRDARAGLNLQLVGDRVGGVGEARDLLLVAVGVVDVVVAIGQQILAPRCEHVVAPEILGERGQLRIVDLFDAQLALVRIEHADDPGEPRIRIGRLQAHFLREVALRVGDVVDRFVVAEARQIDAGQVEAASASAADAIAIVACDSRRRARRCMACDNPDSVPDRTISWK